MFDKIRLAGISLMFMAVEAVSSPPIVLANPSRASLPWPVLLKKP